jgi:hypothetical protein
MIQLPSIMEALDKLDRNKIAERSILIRLLQLCTSLNEQLFTWGEKLKTEVDHLYWTVPSVADNPADDPVLGRIFPLAFQFPSLTIAQLLLLYWSALILLYSTIQDIQKMLRRQVASGTATQHGFCLQVRDRSKICPDLSCPSSDQIALLANNICQSLEYCYHSKNGTFGPQSTIFPLWVARSFYKSQSDRGQELAWCSELGNMTAPDSRFDLYVMKL